jgi:hypothetical protein
MKCRFHDLRHTFASLMLMAGANAKVVSEALGHSSVGFTLDTYSHVLPTMQKAAMSNLDKLLGPAMPENKSISNSSATFGASRGKNWQGRQDSNPRPAVLETAALPAELHPCTALSNTPGASRTHDTRFRKPLLYPLSYRGTMEIGGFEPPTSAMRTQRSPN